MNKVSIWLSAILCTIALASPATANVIARTQIFVTSPEGTFGIAGDQQSLTGGTARAESILPFDEFLGFGAEGRATASLGTLKSFSLADNGSPLLLRTEAWSSFDDVLSIVLLNNSNITLPPSTPGFADIRVAYNWSVRPFATGDANASIILGVSGGSAFAQEGSGGANPLEVSGSTQAIDSILGDFFTVRVPFASAVDLAISLVLLTDAQNDGPGFGTADAFHSAYWGGIVAVRDSDLNIVPFSVTSASGTDYRRSFVPGEVPTVPEPATLSMLCCGFAFLLNRRVRRGRQRPVA